MLIKILLTLVFLLAVIAIVAAFRPATYHVERTITMAAPPARVFAEANDLHKYISWNPFGKSDPQAVYTYEGPPTGVGSAVVWTSKGQTGEGRMSIVESRPNELVRYRLVFIRPMSGAGDMAFTFRPQGNQTIVIWSMAGENGYMGKLMGLFISMDKMIGGAFERGLAEIKTIVEAEARG